MEYRKLFIVRCPRSGTSWVSKFFWHHPDVVSGAESHAYMIIFDHFTYFKRLNFRERMRLTIFLKFYNPIPCLIGFKSKDIFKSILSTYKIYRMRKYIGLHRYIVFEKFKKLINNVKAMDEISDYEKAEIIIEAVFDEFFFSSGGKENDLFVEKTPLHI